MDAKQQEITNYLELDLDSLYSLIPPFVPEYKGTAFMTRGQVAAGWKEFEKLREKLRERLCDNWAEQRQAWAVLVGTFVSVCRDG